MRAFTFAVLVLALPLCLAGTAAPEEKTDPALWEFEPGSEGVALTDLLARVHDVTGENILFNPIDPGIRMKRIDLTGPVRLPPARVFDWLRSVLTYHKLVAVPTGPREAHQWAILNQTDPAIAQYADHVPAEDLPRWADRDGAFIMSVLTVKRLTDTTRVRNALANLVTRPMGRVQDVPGSRSFVVADFAPVVAAMARMVEVLDVAPPVAAARLVVAPKPAPPSPLRHYEQMLCGSRTDIAARYFLDRIVVLTKGDEGD